MCLSVCLSVCVLSNNFKLLFWFSRNLAHVICVPVCTEPWNRYSSFPLVFNWLLLHAHRGLGFCCYCWQAHRWFKKRAYSSSWNSPQNYGTPLVNGITVLYANRQRWPPRLHPNRAGSYSIYRPRKDEWLSWPSWLVIYRNGLPIHRQSPILVLTGSDVAQLRWSKPTRYHQAKPPTAKPNRQPSPVNELTSHSGQLNLAILLWVGKMNTGSGYGHCWGRTASPV